MLGLPPPSLYVISAGRASRCVGFFCFRVCRGRRQAWRATLAHHCEIVPGRTRHELRHLRVLRGADHLRRRFTHRLDCCAGDHFRRSDGASFVDCLQDRLRPALDHLADRILPPASAAYLKVGRRTAFYRYFPPERIRELRNHACTPTPNRVALRTLRKRTQQGLNGPQPRGGESLACQSCQGAYVLRTDLGILRPESSYRTAQTQKNRSNRFATCPKCPAARAAN